MTSVQFSLFDNQGKIKAAESQIAWVDIQSLAGHPDNPRLIYREDIIDAIANSINEHGFKPEYALLVRPFQNGYQVISGHTRLKAATKAGCEKLPCWIKEMDDDEAFMELVLANNQGELSPLEYGMHVLKYVELSEGGRGKKGGLSEYASDTGKDKGNLSRWKSGALVLQAINCCHVTTVLDKANHLSHIHKTPSQYWQQLTELLIENEWSVKQTEEICKAVKSIDIPKHFQEWLPPDKYIKKTISEALSGKIRTPRDIENWVKTAQEIYDRLPTDEQVTVITEDDKKAIEDWDLRGMFLDELPALCKGDKKPSTLKIQELEAKVLNVVKAMNSLVNEWDAKNKSEAERKRKENEERERLLTLKKQYAPVGYNADLMDLMKSSEVELESFNAVITDIPYLVSDGTTTVRSGKEVSVTKNFDDTLHPEEYVKWFAALLKNGGVFVTTCTIHTLQPLLNHCGKHGLTLRQKLVWYKRNSPPLLTADRFKPDYEDILVFQKEEPGEKESFFGYEEIKLNDDKQRGAVIDIPQCGGKERLGWHDTQKPLELYELLVKAYCPKDGRVFEPFAGTGTTAIACKKHQRLCTWVEKDEGFYRDTESRIEESPYFWEV